MFPKVKPAKFWCELMRTRRYLTEERSARMVLGTPIYVPGGHLLSKLIDPGQTSVNLSSARVVHGASCVSRARESDEELKSIIFNYNIMKLFF